MGEKITKMDRQPIISAKDVEITFSLRGKKLNAIRKCSLDLYDGETLAIVGESGSGKSVTSKAIIGILAGNAIVEGGEILYYGKDLLRVPEDVMHKLRGDKISMIFQDPLSSLNPIVKIGKQITEAMLLKNKSNRREARKDFNDMLRLLKTHMLAASDAKDAARINEMCAAFDKFSIQATKLEQAYNAAHSEATELISNLEDPDNPNNQRISVTGVSFDDLTLADWEAARLGQIEAPFTFEDFDILDS